VALILDLIIVAIFVVSIIITAKRGFVKSVSLILGFFLAIFAAMTISGPLSEFIYDKAVEPSIVRTIEKTITSSVDSTKEGLVNGVNDALPGFIKNSVKFDKSDLNNDIVDNDAPKTIAENISRNSVRPITVSFIKVIASLALFVVLSIAFKFLSRILNKIFSFSIVGKLNRFLGGILGLVNGGIYAIIFILLTSFLISLTGGFLIFNPTTVASSYLFNLILEFLPGIF